MLSRIICLFPLFFEPATMACDAAPTTDAVGCQPPEAAAASRGLPPGASHGGRQTPPRPREAAGVSTRRRQNDTETERSKKTHITDRAG